MTQTTYDPSRTAEDGWTSDRWGDPHTQAAPGAPASATSRRRRRSPPLRLPPRVVPARGSPWASFCSRCSWASLRPGCWPAPSRPRAPRPRRPRRRAQRRAPTLAPTTERHRPNALPPGAAPGQRPGALPGTGTDQGTGRAAAVRSRPTAAKVAPSIVNITTTVGYDGAQAAGTGEILTADGYVLTNHHVDRRLHRDQGGGHRHRGDLRRRRRRATTPATTSPSSRCATPPASPPRPSATRRSVQVGDP